MARINLPVGCLPACPTDHPLFRLTASVPSLVRARTKRKRGRGLLRSQMRSQKKTKEATEKGENRRIGPWLLHFLAVEEDPLVLCVCVAR